MVDVYSAVQIVLLVGGTVSILVSAFLLRRYRLGARLVRETARWDARSQDMASRYVIEMEDRRKAKYNRVHDVVTSRPFLVAVPFIVGLAAFVGAYFVLYAVAFGVFVPAVVAIIVLRAAIEPADAVESSVFVKFVATARDSRMNPEDKASIEEARLELKRGSAYFLAFGAYLLTIFGMDRYLGGIVYSGLYVTFARLLHVGLTVDLLRFWTLLGLVTLVSFVFVRTWSQRTGSREEER